MCVAVGREHLENAVLDAQDRDIERPAAQVVDRDDPGVPLVEAISERRGGGLVDDPQHLQARDPSRVTRRGALRVVEVGRHRDDRAIDLGIEVALFGEEGLGAVLQLAQDERGDLRRGELAIADADAEHAARFARDPEREMARLGLNVLASLSHEPLHGVDGPLRVRQQPALRFASDIDRVVRGDRHHRRHQAVAVAIADDGGHAVLHVRDERVRGA